MVARPHRLLCLTSLDLLHLDFISQRHDTTVGCLYLEVVPRLSFPSESSLVLVQPGPGPASPPSRLPLTTDCLTSDHRRYETQPPTSPLLRIHQTLSFRSPSLLLQ